MPPQKLQPVTMGRISVNVIQHRCYMAFRWAFGQIRNCLAMALTRFSCCIRIYRMDSSTSPRLLLLAAASDAFADRLGDFRSLVERTGEYAVLLFGHDESRLRECQKFASGGDAPGIVEAVTFPRGASSQNQAALILEHADRMLSRAGGDPASVSPWLMLEGLSVGLYEAICRCYSPGAERLFKLTQPRPFCAAPYPRRHEDPFAHQLPDNPIEWQDREFSLSLMDEEETDQLRRCLLSRRSLLLTGERGTGKTLLARYIHCHSADTAKGSFVEANLAAIPETLVEQELLGIAPGTATDVRGRDGLLREAHMGTLFLDEIAEASPNTQAKLLRIVSERIEPIQYRRLGETRNQLAHVRFMAATNLPASDIDSHLRSDLRSRFPVRVHLKRISEKSDAFACCLRAIEHFASIDLVYNPALVPTWDRDALYWAFEQGMLPDNYRDLHTFVTRVWDARVVADKPWLPHVGKNEIIAAIREPGRRAENEASRVAGAAGLFLPQVQAILSRHDFGEREALSEDEMKQLIYGLKHLALRLATWYGSENRALARRVYGMPNPKSFEKLCRNPVMLHPDTRRRSHRRK